MNDKGEIILWKAQSKDGKLLKILVENGNIGPNITAGDKRKNIQCSTNIPMAVSVLLFQMQKSPIRTILKLVKNKPVRKSEY